MAVTASGLFVATFLDVLDASQNNVNLVGDTIKCAMFTDTVTPNFSTDTAYGAAPYNANEVSGSGYTAGGVTLTTKAFTEAVTGSVVFDADDAQWTSSTITNAMCALIWDDTTTTPVADVALCLVDFVTAASTSNGTFTITWAAPGSGGIFNIDLTP